MTTGSALLARAVERVALDAHDGRSGAGLERVRLDDGTRLVVKRSDPAADITVLSGGVARERALWSAGVLDRLPAGVAHAIVDVWDDDGVTVTVMRDLGDAVGGWDRRLARGACRRILHAVSAVHAGFVAEVPAGLCPLEDRLTLLSPQVIGRLAHGINPLPALVVRGWQRFADLVDGDLVDAVFAIHADPTPLAAAMRLGTTTMLHGDLWPVNVALEPSCVVLLDWALATEGPPALDLAVFLTGAASHVDASRAQIIGDFREVSGELTDDGAIRLALLAGLVELGWNKALDATEQGDPAVRAAHRTDLDWWVDQALQTLEARLL